MIPEEKHTIFPLNLTAKIAIVVAEVLLITVGISAYIGITIQEERLINRTKDESYTMSNTIHNQLERAMLSGRREEVQRFLADLGNSNQVIEASVFDPKGTIIFSSNTAKLFQKIHSLPVNMMESKGSQVFLQSEARRKKLSILTPISNKKACQQCHPANQTLLGVLYYRPSLDWIMQESAENRKLMIYSAAITVGISVLVITLLMKGLVRQPIHALEKVISKVAEGDLTQRVEVQSEDEIGRLGQHFNTMIGQLEVANKKLEEAHEADLLRAGKLASLGELAAGLVHEMKNPLSGISAATQVLHEQLPETDARREVMQEMIVQVERLNKTLNDLLSFAKPRSPQLSAANINEVVKNVVLLTRSQAEQHQIQIHENYQQDLPRVKLDPEQIKQVLLNLVLNAFQAMSNGGILNVETKIMSDSKVTVIVKDSGRGITSENMEKIFEPFFTTRAKGTGLGLPVSRKIVEMHGGSMDVYSEPGNGTTFRIHLPIESVKGKV